MKKETTYNLASNFVWNFTIYIHVDRTTKQQQPVETSRVVIHISTVAVPLHFVFIAALLASFRLPNMPFGGNPMTHFLFHVFVDLLKSGSLVVGLMEAMNYYTNNSWARASVHGLQDTKRKGDIISQFMGARNGI